MKVCPNCGFNVEDDHMFCMECGYKFEESQAETAPVTSEMADVNNHIMWNIQPGQVARLITEKEFLQYSGVSGIIVSEGTRVLVRKNAEEFTMLSSGIYTFPKPEVPEQQPSKGFIRNVFASADVPQPELGPADLYSILLVRDGDFPVIFGSAESTGESFVPMTVQAKNLEVQVGLSAMLRISSMQVFLARTMVDRTSLHVSDLVGMLAPKVEMVLRKYLADVEVSEKGISDEARTDIERILAGLAPELGGVAFSSVEEIRVGHDALERFRALDSELYLTSRELEYLERTNEFKNRLAAAQNAQQLDEARNDLALMRALQAINQDKLLAEDELEKFYMVLSREKKIREAQNEDQIAAALADIEKTGLIRAEDLNQLRDEIRTKEHQRGHAFRMMQKKDELEVESLQREYEKRIREEDYEFEKKKKDDEFNRFRDLEKIRGEREAAEHDRNMEALREMQKAKMDKLRLSRELTPEQLLAASAENLDPEAVARLAESLGRNREAEYLERLTQARIEDMKEMMRNSNETAREYIRSSAPGSENAQQSGKFCPACGNRNSADAKFCMSCGKQLI